MSYQYPAFDMADQFAARFKVLRGMVSQEAIAKELYVKQSKISDWERGKSFPNANDIDMLFFTHRLEF